ncbi:MAG: cation-translocating P-type ATPase [Anaerolineales bacterium]|nr:cation-translocating P-type ATPase [Anaerolineales bacterium]
MVIEKQTWHTQTIEQTCDTLQVTPESGLSETKITNRRSEFGPNELIEHGLRSPWHILFDQFREAMVVVLIIAAIISVILSDWKDAVAIVVIVVLNAALGFIQEYRAEKTMAALKQMAAPVVKVRRAGRIVQIAAQELVPGDVILLEVGDAIPADARILQSVNLRVQEAALTGEAVPVEKNTTNLEEENLTLGDRTNMLFLGTAITYGRGMAVVVHTGMDTELGHIANLLQTVVNEQTPLQKRMDQLGKSLAWVALAIVGVVFGLGLLRGENAVDMFLTAVAMAIAAVPEGLPAVVTISLALGAQRMLKRKALIRKLPAVETLGSVTTICSDKTGTLTENRMTVTILDVFGETVEIDALLDGGIPVVDAEISPDAQPSTRSLGLMLKAAALCNDAVLDSDPSDGSLRALGDPTEGALVVAAAQMGLSKSDLDHRWPRVSEIPFTSERKRMTTVHRMALADRSQSDAPWRDSPFVAFSKGAVAELLAICTQIWVGDSAIPATDELRQRIQTTDDHMAQNGQRVLGLAFRPLNENAASLDDTVLEQDLTFIGLIGMLDPPRPEVEEAVETCRAAGIRPVMITGDHPLTAKRIAQDLGIADNDNIMTGVALSKISLDELENIVEDVSVFARVAPEHKLNIVQALQNKGHIVAMTGDGVNDAPALRRSDIGVAMGITGTDVSKEAADMVILDDNFATIVNAVEEGRTIYDNVRKFIKYTLTSNAGEIYLMLFAPFLGMPLPLTALQILWINLVTDGLPGLALSVEQPERNTMQRKPYPPNEGIFARGMGGHILWVGLLMGMIALGIGFWGWKTNNPYWPTMVFTTITLSQMGNALAVRSERESLFRMGLFSNKLLLAAVTLTLVLQLGITYWEPAQAWFGTMPLPPFELAISLGLSTVVFGSVEVEKLFKRIRSKER